MGLIAVDVAPGVMNHAPYILLYASIEAVAMMILYLFILPSSLKTTKLAVANMITSIGVAALISGSALLGVKQTFTSTSDRWFGTTSATHLFLEMYVAHNLLLVVLDCFEDAPLRSKIPMLAHHLLSCIAYSGGMQTHRMHFFACFDGVCEVCNLFLNPFLLMRHKEGQFGEHFTKRLGGFAMANNLLLWLSFFVFRMLLFPTWLAVFAVDTRSMFVERTSVLASQDSLTWFELTFYPAVTLFLLFLSSIWFSKLTKGALKEMRKGKEV